MTRLVRNSKQLWCCGWSSESCAVQRLLSKKKEKKEKEGIETYLLDCYASFVEKNPYETRNTRDLHGYFFLVKKLVLQTDGFNTAPVIWKFLVAHKTSRS